MKAGAAWEWGRFGEDQVRALLQRQGFYVLPTHAIETGGAPAIVSDLRRHVVPDLQVSGRGRTAWWEVKFKDHPVLYQKVGKWRHGIDLSKWKAYLQVEAETGLPGFLAIYQLRPGPNAPMQPWLLVASFAELRRGRQISDTSDGPRVWWDIDQFEVEELSAGCLPDFPRLTRVVHPWEQPSRAGVAPRASRDRQLRLEESSE